MKRQTQIGKQLTAGVGTGTGLIRTQKEIGGLVSSSSRNAIGVLSSKTGTATAVFKSGDVLAEKNRNSNIGQQPYEASDKLVNQTPPANEGEKPALLETRNNSSIMGIQKAPEATAVFVLDDVVPAR